MDRLSVKNIANTSKLLIGIYSGNLEITNPILHNVFKAQLDDIRPLVGRNAQVTEYGEATLLTIGLMLADCV